MELLPDREGETGRSSRERQQQERKKSNISFNHVHKTLMVDISDLIKIFSQIFAIGPYINITDSNTAFSHTF